MAYELAPLPQVAVIVPTFNEEDRLPPTLEATLRVLDEEYPRGAYRVTVVDDGSTDKTIDVAKSFGVHVLARGHEGKGAAVSAAMLESEASVRAFMDADGSFTPEHLLRVVDSVIDGAKIAIATRDHGIDALSQHADPVRALGSRLMAWTCERIAPTGVSDVQAGMKAFRGDIADYLFSNTDVKGFARDRQLMHVCHLLGIEIAEIPGNVTPMDGSKVRPLKDGLQMLRDAFYIRRATKQIVDMQKAGQANYDNLVNNPQVGLRTM
jgi:glycosyltransferase involved in cell wall biosynthesis